MDRRTSVGFNFNCGLCHHFEKKNILYENIVELRTYILIAVQIIFINGIWDKGQNERPRENHKQFLNPNIRHYMSTEYGVSLCFPEIRLYKL